VPFFWHISETVRATSPHMSRKVERNEDFEKNMLIWRDLTTFITAFCDFVIDNGRLRSHFYTQKVGGAKMTSHHRGFVGNQVQSDSIFLNTMHNNLHYGKSRVTDFGPSP